MHYHEVATCSFLTKESAWFKKLTLALNVFFLSFDETLFATVKVYDMLILNLKTANTLNLFPDQFIIKILIPSTHNGLVYLKIRNYKETFYVITKSIDKMKAETTLESLDFIHKITDMIRLK